MTSHRIERLNEQLKRELTEILRTELRDPRVSGVTVTRVQTTPDLQQARVFLTSLDEEAERKTTMEGLAAARPFLRTALAQRIQLRRTPELLFEWDAGLDHARRIEELLARVRLDESRGEDDDDNG